MKCGNCKDDHGTTAQVLLCYSRAGKIDATKVKTANAERPGEPKYQASNATRHHKGRRELFGEFRAVAAKVPAGRYALPTRLGAKNEIALYKVAKDDRGYTWVRRFSSETEIKLRVEDAIGVLTRIAADPQGASLLYGKEDKRCGVCGLRLTNDVSRERGIGPKCAKRMGWEDAA